MTAKEVIGAVVILTSVTLFGFGIYQAIRDMPPEQQIYRLRYTVVTSLSEDATSTAEIEEEHQGIEAARAKAHFIAGSKCLQSRIRIERTHPTIREVESVEQSDAAEKRNCKQ